MPAARLFLRIALLLTPVCAALVLMVDGLASLLPSNGMIYFSHVGRGDSTHLFDPLHRVRYDLSSGYNIPGDYVLSPDGEQLAYAYHDTATDQFEVRVFDVASTQMTRLFRTPNHVIDAVYSWSPSARYLSFRSGGRLLKYDFQTDAVSPVIGESRDDYFNDSFPVWSPDETQIAFVSSLRETNTWQGYLVNADGSDLRRVTRVDVCQFYAPSWSPDGSVLALNAQCENVPNIFLLDVATGRLRAFSDLDVPMWNAQWSPDGSRLVFMAGIQERRIYTSRADGSAQQFVVMGDFAHWSPDGERILFSSSEGDLYTIGADGSNPQRLTFGEGKPFLLARGWS
jgi:Tol biopolymer transport system component